MFDDLKKDLSGAANAVGGVVSGAVNDVSTGLHDVASDFGAVTHAIGNAINPQSQQPAQQQAAPPMHLANPVQQQQQQTQGFQPTQNKLPTSTPQNPLGLNNPNGSVGGIKIAPTNNDALAGLRQQQQNANAVKVSNPKTAQNSGLLNGLKNLGSDVVHGGEAVGNFVKNTAVNTARLPVQFSEDYSNTFANLGNKLGGGQDVPIQQNMGGTPGLNTALKFSQATGTNKQLAGDVGQVGLMAATPGIDNAATNFVTKSGLPDVAGQWASNLAGRAVANAGVGAGFGAAGAYGQGGNTQQILKAAGENALLGGGLSVGGELAGKLPDVATDFKNQLQPLNEAGYINGGDANGSLEETPESPRTPEIQPENNPVSQEERQLDQTNSSANNTPSEADIQSFQSLSKQPMSREQAIAELSEVNKPQELPDPGDVTQNFNDNLPDELTPEERQRIIDENSNQQTDAQHTFQAKDLQPAIAEVDGKLKDQDYMERQAMRATKKLSKADQARLSDRLNGEDVGKVDDRNQFQKAAELAKRAYDNRLALGRAGGDLTLRRNNGNYANLEFKIDDKTADEQDIPQEDRIIKNGKTIGYHSRSSKYKSYADALRQTGGKLQRLNPSTLDDIKDYFGGGKQQLTSNLLRTNLGRLFPDEVDLSKDTENKNGVQLETHKELGFNMSNRIHDALRNYTKPWEPKNGALKVAVKGLEKANAASKFVQFFGTPFHYVNETASFIGKNLLNPKNVAIGTGRLIRTVASRNGFDAMMEKARERGSLEKVHAMGVELNDSNKLERATSAYALTEAEGKLRAGIDPYSNEGRAMGASINRLVGRKNDVVEGVNPNVTKLLRGAADAPRWTPSQLALLRDAVNPLNLTSKTGRQTMRFGAEAVTGKRILEGGVAVGASAALAAHEHRKQTKQDLLNEAGLTLKNPVPNIQIGSKNSKGESQELALPTDQAGLAVGLVTNPSHFLQSRYSPTLGFAAKVATNQNWNGDPLSDPNKPLSQQIGTRIKNAALNSYVPIGVQNLTNLQKNVDNPNIKQGIGQDFGLRLKTNPNDPQIVSTNQYFNQQAKYGNDLATGNFKAVNSALSNVSPKEAAYWSAQLKSYEALSPGKDLAGVENSSQWNALSEQQKASYFLMNDQKTGAQTLSPIFYIEQQLTQQDPNRPHSPLYDLKGNNGVGFTLNGQGNVTGTKSLPQAQVALNYQSESDPTQKSLMLAANPWLANYENAVGNYSQNYKPVMTQYMQKEGWNKTAINQYWADHPDSPPVIQSAVTPDQQNLMNQYEAIKDPTAQSDFFDSNAKELSAAFTASAIYSSKDSVAKGSLPSQIYPNPSPQVNLLLNEMQKNPTHDKAISAFNSQLINNNPQLNQYLANIGIYDLAKDAGKYQYQDPTHPGMSAAQLLNLQRPIDQTTLKDISDVGNYDIGYNANAPAGQQYQFMGAGGPGAFGTGYGSGSGSGSSKSLPLVALPKIKRAKFASAKRPPKLRKASKVYVRSGPKPYKGTSVSIQHGSNVAKAVKVIH